MKSNFIISTLLLVVSTSLVSASAVRRDATPKQGNSGTDSVTLQYESINHVPKDNSSNTRVHSNNQKSRDSFNLLEIGQNGIKRRGFLENLNDEDWNILLDAVKKSLQVEEKPVMRLDLLQDVFSKLVMKYHELTLFDFQNGLDLSVGQYLSQKEKPVFHWEGQINFQKLNLPENPNTLLLMESIDDGFMQEYSEHRDSLKKAFEKSREEIRKDNENSAYLDLDDLQFISFDGEGMVMVRLIDFASKLFIKFGSTAKPYIDRGQELIRHIESKFGEEIKEIEEVSKNKPNYRSSMFTDDLQKFMQNVLADSGHKNFRRRFEIFDKVFYSSEFRDRLERKLNVFFDEEYTARYVRIYNLKK